MAIKAAKRHQALFKSARQFSGLFFRFGLHFLSLLTASSLEAPPLSPVPSPE